MDNRKVAWRCAKCGKLIRKGDYIFETRWGRIGGLNTKGVREGPVLVSWALHFKCQKGWTLADTRLLLRAAAQRAA
jgi:hypothetical protein